MIRIEESGSHLRILPENTPRGRALFFHGYGFGRFETLPLTSRIAWGGWEVWVPELPGHGFSPDELSPETLADFGREMIEETRPDVIIGHSLGGRLAISLSARQIVALSPPVDSDWSKMSESAREEILRHLRPRWVKEGRPMEGLAASLRTLEVPSSGSARALVLLAQKDLQSVESGLDLWKGKPGWSVERIRHTDHSSILLSRTTAERILEWLPN